MTSDHARLRHTGGVAHLLRITIYTVRVLRARSKQLADLKAFPAGVPVHALYEETVFTVQKLGWFHKPRDVDKVPFGDLVVLPDSATHGVKLTQKASCSYQLSPIRGATDSSGLTIGTTAKNDVAQPVTSALGRSHDDCGRSARMRVHRPGNLYTETNPECVSYANSKEDVSFSVERKSGRILAIKSGSRNMTTQVGKVRAGFTLAQLRNAFLGYRIAERFDFDFGQGTNGVIVNGAGERSASASTTRWRRTTSLGR